MWIRPGPAAQEDVLPAAEEPGNVLKKAQNIGEQPKGSVTGEWRKQEDGSWKFVSGGRTYANEWAWIYNPYAKEGQEKTSWFHFAADGRSRQGGFSMKKMEAGIISRRQMTEARGKCRLVG